jgi:hypothetical protein
VEPAWDGMEFRDRTDAKSIVAAIMSVRLLIVDGVQTLLSLDYKMVQSGVFIGEKRSVNPNCHFFG